ncbi:MULTISPECIES: DUF4886 domain-containing protein [unclassified Butyrivibrio]|jgi:hypothetical protein|uniref:DUF4886 domain-containing protein n=1 Tax=unclassified Butyrivibrio TaxID=2639466 RepID=UPI00041A48A0|nr:MULTISPECIES: DUF4886 domain-containing protein [unclassified Butyrivibrio]
MKTTYILAIGNSFSRDATAYLYDVCKSMDIPVHVVNLYIGGCPLERHWENIEKNEHAYQYQENGVVTDRYVSIQDILHSKPWDYIVTQQSSHDSGWLDTYEPFAGLMFDYIKKEVPGAQICMQQTWAYEIDSDHGCFIRYNRDQLEMYRRSRANYHTIADKYNIPLIPCGDVIQNIRKHPEFDVARGGKSICRDGFHMHYLYGRYALACTWAKTLLNAPIENCTYLPNCCDTDEELDEALLSIVKQEVVSI